MRPKKKKGIHRDSRSLRIESLEQRVLMTVGGQPAPIGEGEFTVALTNGRGNQFCGGVVVADEWVMTAAHCVNNARPNRIRVAVGNRVSAAREHQVRSIVTHSDYDPKTADSDIAMIRVRGKLDAPALRPVPPRNADKLAQPRDVATVYGFGARHENDYLGTDYLQKVTVPIVSNHIANRARWYDGEVTDNMLPAGRKQGGVDSCYGDSGGPLVVNNGRGQPRLAGIVSWGIGCARPTKPGIYTRVSNFVPWMRDVLAGRVSRSGAAGTPANSRLRSDNDGAMDDAPDITHVDLYAWSNAVDQIHRDRPTDQRVAIDGEDEIVLLIVARSETPPKSPASPLLLDDEAVDEIHELLNFLIDFQDESTVVDGEFSDR